jgi:hypothetical protein
MDERVEAIVEKLIEKSEKGEIEWRESGSHSYEARISDCTVAVRADYPHVRYVFELRSDKAGSMACLRAGDNKRYFDLLRALHNAAKESHEKEIDKALKSLAESLVESEVEDPARTAILNKEIRDTNLSCRATWALRYSGGLKTVRDITALPDATELLKFRNIGRITAREIEGFLSEHGLSFGMTLTTK